MKTFKFYFKLLFIITFVTFFNSFYINAQNNNFIPASNLQASPAKIIQNLKPGDSFNVDIYLSQNQNSNLKIKSSLVAIHINNNDSIKFDEDLDPNIKNWAINLPTEITLEKNILKNIKINLNIPIDTEIKGYLFGISFLEENSSPTSLTNSTSLQQRIVIPFAINILNNMPVNETLNIQEISVPNIIINNNISYNTTIINSGITNVIPLGVIQINKVIGIGDFLFKENFNDKNNLILPGNSKQFSENIKFTTTSIGKYNFKLAIVYGKDNKVIVKQISVYIIPYWILILISIILIIFVYITIKLKKKKSYDKN